jgi:hypothetical protein
MESNGRLLRNERVTVMCRFCRKLKLVRNYVRNALKKWTNGLVADVSRRDAVSK